MTATRLATPLDEGAMGFDTNTPLSRTLAAAFVAHGYQFALRYVPRLVQHENDLTAGEVAILRAAGLGLMVVQHVEPGMWIPSAAKGTAYGHTAAVHCRDLGIATGTSVWLDLESVMPGTVAETTIAYCNAWCDQVQAAGFLPGLYVGWRCGLTAEQLYRRLKFTRYWAAYNLNLDQYPARRGCVMLQREARGADIPPGVHVPIDVNLVTGDHFGGFPMMDCGG